MERLCEEDNVYLHRAFHSVNSLIGFTVVSRRVSRQRPSSPIRFFVRVAAATVDIHRGKGDFRLVARGNTGD